MISIRVGPVHELIVFAAVLLPVGLAADLVGPVVVFH